MASPVQNNDESTITTTTAAVSITEPATTAKNVAINATSDTSISTNGIDEKSPQQQTGVDTPIRNGKEEGLQNSATSPTDSGGGSASFKSNESSTVTTPGTAVSMSSGSSNVSFQTPTSAPRSKPLEKPKPLKLEQHHHVHHTSQSQILFHPAAAGPGAFALGPSVLGAMQHPIYVGAGHFVQQQAASGLPHHIQTAIHQHNQQQQANFNHPAGDGTTAVSTDEILETMEQINRSVKAGQFSTTLAGYIFRLYGYLKHVGELLEQSHKNEMNRVFVSLRQACCRDSGQLGTPCRLKIMELVELRAMAWRPNLAHSQYYLNRSGGSMVNGFNGTSTISEYNPISSTDAMSGGDMEQLGAAPVSAPPFGTFSINPFAFNIPPTSMAGGGTPVASAAELVSSAAAAACASMTQQGPSYYLIPASHVGHTQAGIAFISPTAAATVLPPPPISPMAASAAAAAAAAAHHQQRLHMPVTASLSQPALTGVGINPSTSPPGAGNSGIFPRGAVTKTSGKYSRPAKIPGKSQYRDEVVIRNADSGKIMGVKGRRVAIIEELSKTIISFQKVPQGAKERTLTITGPSEEAIEQAKVLIEETIRRNVSPIRGEGVGEDLYRGASLITACFGDDLDDNASAENGDEASEEGAEGKERTAADGGSGDGREFSIEAGQLGEMLKLQCNDPALLEAAKQALSAYFRGQKQPQGHSALRRTTTDAAARDQTRKERRKSMPAIDNPRALALKQSSPPQMDGNQPGGADETPSNANGEQENVASAEAGRSSKPLTLTMMISPPIGKQKASSAARSTPNLAATGLNKRALCLMKSVDANGRGFGGAGDESAQVETKFMADESGGGTLVVHEKKNRVTVRVVYTREFVLQCAASPFTSLTPAGLPWMTRETPEILRPVPGKFDINEYKQMCIELRQLHQ